MLAKDYPTFVRLLGENIKDPKFLAALRAGDKDKDKVRFELDTSYPLYQLIPTQNAIDIEKSLKWPLSEQQCPALLSYLQADAGSSFAPGGPIVTAGGKYIIDGHHRWGQIFLINPQARIKALNMKVSEPVDALKFTQMAIASVAGGIPASFVSGENIYTINKASFSLWIKEHISPCAIEAFNKVGIDGIDAIIDYIWSNVLLMRKNNLPIEGAPNRGLMPQTDKAKGWLESLSEGRVNIREVEPSTCSY